MTSGIVLTETRHAGGFMVSEQPSGRFSRDSVTLGQSQTIVAGQVLGKSTAGFGTLTPGAGTAGGSNTGNGTISTVTAGAGCQAGTYRMVADAALRWDVFDPSGRNIGQALDAVAFAGQIGFTITHGATAFAAGDTFSVAVTETDPSDAGQYKALNLSATDGSQNAVAISWGNYTTGSGVTMTITVIDRDAEVRGVDLTYPAGATNNQIGAINAQLLALGIVVR